MGLRAETLGSVSSPEKTTFQLELREMREEEEGNVTEKERETE